MFSVPKPSLGGIDVARVSHLCLDSVPCPGPYLVGLRAPVVPRGQCSVEKPSGMCVFTLQCWGSQVLQGLQSQETEGSLGPRI